MIKRSAFFIFVLTLLFTYNLISEEVEVNQLGVHPFYKSRDLKKDDLLKIATEKAEEVKTGFELAGYAELYDDFIKQLQTADLEEIEIHPGDTIQWMMFKKRRKVEVKKDVKWTAKKPFTAYRFTFTKDEKDYEFIVPKVCGNISLKGVKDHPKPPPPPPPPPKNKPPTCDLKVTPLELFKGQTVTLDASGSKDPDGTIASVKFLITAADGSVIEEKVLTETPYTYTTKMKKVGKIKIEAIVTDDKGDTSPGNSCVVEVDVKKRGFMLADIGVLYQPDPAWFLPIRAGYMHKFSDSVAIVVMGGVAPVVSGDDDSTAILGDLTLNFGSKKMWFGIGTGVFHTENKTRGDLIMNVGVVIVPRLSLFFEGRVAYDEFEDIGDLGRFGLGLRYKFK
jgi:hypothetical protein